MYAPFPLPLPVFSMCALLLTASPARVHRLGRERSAGRAAPATGGRPPLPAGKSFAKGWAGEPPCAGELPLFGCQGLADRPDKDLGNPPDDSVLGMVVPAEVSPAKPNSWAVILQYEEEGFVKDNDAATINYDDLLKTMREQTAAGRTRHAAAAGVSRRWNSSDGRRHRGTIKRPTNSTGRKS